MNNKSVWLNYIEANKKVFILIVGVFFVGMILGIFLINHTSESQMKKINDYVLQTKENIKKTEEINKLQLFIKSVKQNYIFVFIIWILGCTIIGSFLVYLAIAYKGFSLGYTISAIIASLGPKCGSIFVFSSLLLQNIIFLPAIFLLAESGIKVYSRIHKYNVNLKNELIRHTAIMLIVLIMTLVSSVFEVYISINLLTLFKNFM